MNASSSKKEKDSKLKERYTYKNKFLKYSLDDFENMFKKEIPLQLNENIEIVEQAKKQAKKNILRNKEDFIKIETLLAETCEYYNELVTKARPTSFDAIVTAKYLSLSYIKWIKETYIDTIKVLDLRSCN